MAYVTGVWNLQRFRFGRRDEVESMTANFLVGNRLGDLRHVTRDAFVASAATLMMGMRLDRGGMWPSLCVGTMTVETQRIAGFAHHGNIVAAMRIVAAKTRDAASIHQALHEIVALHPVLVRGSVRKVRKGKIAELMFFELPVVL